MTSAARQNAARDFDRIRMDALGYTTPNDVFTNAYGGTVTAFGSTPLVRASFNLNTGAVLTIREVYNGVTVNHVANAGAALTAGQTGQFDLDAIPGATYQAILSVNQSATAWRGKLTVVQFA